MLYLYCTGEKLILLLSFFPGKPTALLCTGQALAETQIGHHTCQKPHSRLKGIIFLRRTLTKALFRASKSYQRSKVCHWTFLCYILVTQTASLPHTFSYILSTVFSIFPHNLKLLTVCNSYCTTERTVRCSNPRTRKRFFSS